MFFIKYLMRELRRRMRQSVVIGLGLALGVGLVTTVTAASTGVQNAEATVLHSLYGIGTDVTVTKPPSNSRANGAQKAGPGADRGSGPQMCLNGTCGGRGQTIDILGGGAYAPMPTSQVDSVADLRGVKNAVGGLTLNDTKVTIPSSASGSRPEPTTFSVDGVDLAHRDLGPLSAASVTAGRDLKPADANDNAALVDSNYASANDLKAGSTIKVAGKKFNVVGIISQPQASSPPDVYIPLARAQALGTSQGESLHGKVNAIYVAATSAGTISLVQKEISNLMPAATVTTSANLADQVTGSVSSAATLADVLGRWLSVLVLIAAFAVAALLTMAAVTRRAREFGTLKAIGWRTRRIIGQVLGESVAIGILGGAAGVGLGFLGAAIISAIAPKLSATVAPAQPQMTTMGPGGAARGPGQDLAHTVYVPLAASVPHNAIVLGVVLAIVGGLIAGAFASWRIARLRPVDALARVA